MKISRRGQANISVCHSIGELICNFMDYCIYLPHIAFSTVGLSFWHPFIPSPFMFETAMAFLMKRYPSGRL